MLALSERHLTAVMVRVTPESLKHVLSEIASSPEVSALDVPEPLHTSVHEPLLYCAASCVAVMPFVLIEQVIDPVDAVQEKGDVAVTELTPPLVRFAVQ